MNKSKVLVNLVENLLAESMDYNNPNSSIVFHKKMKNMPTEINGKKFEKWASPANDKEWENVDGQDRSIKEPPMKIPKHKKAVSGLFIHEKDGRVWLVKPTDGFGGYDHTFPKGHLEPNLHPQANAIKEAYEESGIKARITGYAGDINGHSRVTRYYHAVRETGHPLDHGWESEAVTLAHPKHLKKFLNTERDIGVAKQYLSTPTKKE